MPEHVFDAVTRATARATPPRPERARAAPRAAGGEAALLDLQRLHGNRYVQRAVALGRAVEGGTEAGPEVEGAIERARGGGRPLDAGVRATMEGALGADFTTVRVHTGAHADSLNSALGARAFTAGRDVFFASGEYDPGSRNGRELIAHELAHVVQQTGGPRAKLAVGPPDDRFEREADRIARAVVEGEPAVPPVFGGLSVRPRLQRQLTSNPPNMEEELRQQGLLQRKARVASRRGEAIQRRGGASVGRLSVMSNVVSAGLTAGHAWLRWEPAAAAATTYGTWGNRTPIGLHRDLELGAAAAASRTTDLDATDQGSLTSFAGANNAWSLLNNCASFAARGWRSVTGESVSYTTIGIPNPSALGAGIVSANGGATGGVLAAAAPAPAPSSSSL